LEPLKLRHPGFVGIINFVHRGSPMPIDLVGLLAVFSILFVPITGVMLILTTRFAFKPLVETLAKALRDSGHSLSDSAAFSNQVLLEELESLREEVRELKLGQEFDQKLLSSPSGNEQAVLPTEELKV
jgi:hypothetical protein